MTPAAEERLVAVLERLATALEGQLRLPVEIEPVECSERGVTARRLCVDRGGLAAMLGISERSVQRLADRGLLPPPIALGRARRWHVATIEDWLAAGAPPRAKWAAGVGPRIESQRSRSCASVRKPAESATRAPRGQLDAHVKLQSGRNRLAGSGQNEPSCARAKERENA